MEFYYSDMVRRSGSLNIPETHRDDQYWVLYNHEAPAEHHRVYSLLHSGMFNLSANYRKDADIVLKYGECLSRSVLNYTTSGVNFAANKSGLVVWHASNCHTPSKRGDYVKQLKKHIVVDIVGKCGPSKKGDSFNSTIRLGHPVTLNEVDNFNRYKFYLSFENTFCDQYITEKVYKIFQDDITVVPVVRGSGPYKDLLPPGSYIDAADFTTPQALAEYLNKLDKNDTLYNQYFKAREKCVCYNIFRRENAWPCAVCRKICHLKRQGIRQTLDQGHIEDIFLPKNQCYYPSNFSDKRLLNI